MTRVGFASAVAAAALLGCAQQPLWKPEPAPAKPAPALEQEMAPEPEVEPPPPVIERKPAPVAKPEPPRRAPAVQAGVTAYDDGNHKEAARLLRAALRTKLGTRDQVEAHKYLAFVECSANRRTQCRDEFRRALAIDPTFDLTAAESGHPIWGPLFREVKQSKSRR